MRKAAYFFKKTGEYIIQSSTAANKTTHSTVCANMGVLLALKIHK
jgi:hypothetical protein